MDEIYVQVEEPIIQVQVATPGVSKFIELEDTPQTYTDGKFVKVKNGRLVFDVPQGGGDMLMSIYDPNHNEIVDYTEGIRVLNNFPTSAKKGDLIVVNNKVYINL